jgi:hypothetical protein
MPCQKTDTATYIFAYKGLCIYGLVGQLKCRASGPPASAPRIGFLGRDGAEAGERANDTVLAMYRSP